MRSTGCQNGHTRVRQYEGHSGILQSNTGDTQVCCCLSVICNGEGEAIVLPLLYIPKTQTDRHTDDGTDPITRQSHCLCRVNWIVAGDDHLSRK